VTGIRSLLVECFLVNTTMGRFFMRIRILIVRLGVRKLKSGCGLLGYEELIFSKYIRKVIEQYSHLLEFAIQSLWVEDELLREWISHRFRHSSVSAKG